MNIYVALSTIPSRLPTLHETIEALLKQTLLPTKILISIPKKYKRFKSSESKIQAALKLLPKNKIVEVIRCDDDDGPGTKLLGCLSRIDSLQKASNRPFMIILVDDDILYKNYLVQTMFQKMKINKECAYSYYTWRSHSNLSFGQGVDGFAINGKHLKRIKDFYKFLLKREPLFFYHDDFWISLFLYFNRVKIRSMRRHLHKGDKRIYDPLPASYVDALVNLKGKKARMKLHTQLEKFTVEHQEVLFQFLSEKVA